MNRFQNNAEFIFIKKKKNLKKRFREKILKQKEENILEKILIKKSSEKNSWRKMKKAMY